MRKYENDYMTLTLKGKKITIYDKKSKKRTQKTHKTTNEANYYYQRIYRFHTTKINVPNIKTNN